MKFCGECGAALKARCANCGTENPPQFKFCGECGASLTESETVRRAKGETESPLAPPDSKPKTLDSRLAGERRQLTVQFIDLVGSTALSQQLDPEDYHGRVRAYQAACGQVITRYDGHIAQYLGDGVLVYFGYPAAHEEDAARAVRSGLEVVAAGKPAGVYATLTGADWHSH